MSAPRLDTRADVEAALVTMQGLYQAAMAEGCYVAVLRIEAVLDALTDRLIVLMRAAS